MPGFAGDSTPRIARRSACLALASHSFADGLHRLFLGYALPTAVDAPLGAWLAAGDAEGSGATALGGLAQAVRALERAQRDLTAPKPAARW